MNLLLDTCAALWIADGEPIAQSARNEIEKALQADQAVFVSPITAWEIGMLASRGRISLRLSPAKWFQKLLEAPGLMLAALDPDILIASSFLPNSDLRDPADRIIVATAREHGYRIVTRDTAMLAYADRGFCRTVAC